MQKVQMNQGATMKTNNRLIALSVMLTGMLWQIGAQAAPVVNNQTENGYALKAKKTDSSITLASNTSTNATDDSSLGLKIGSKNNIQLYGTVEIGYSKWSQKN